MKLALSIPDSEAHNPIKGGADGGCEELGGETNSLSPTDGKEEAWK